MRMSVSPGIYKQSQGSYKLDRLMYIINCTAQGVHSLEFYNLNIFK